MFDLFEPFSARYCLELSRNAMEVVCGFLKAPGEDFGNNVQQILVTIPPGVPKKTRT